jgi:hypothetical protein
MLSRSKSKPPNQFLNEVWVNEKGLAAVASANPSNRMVAGAGFAECYTQPDALWIDLIP